MAYVLARDILNLLARDAPYSGILYSRCYSHLLHLACAGIGTGHARRATMVLHDIRKHVISLDLCRQPPSLAEGGKLYFTRHHPGAGMALGRGSQQQILCDYLVLSDHPIFPALPRTFQTPEQRAKA